ncbi:hypothetical protein SLA2020_324510 [Shorea laevis]
MVEIFRMKVEKSYMRGSKLKLPSSSSGSKINELPTDEFKVRYDQSNSTWSCCTHKDPSNGLDYLHVKEWDHFAGIINGREIVLNREDDPFNEVPYKFEVKNN